MKRLPVTFSTLILYGLIGVFTVAEAQSQAGGLPDVSARVNVLEGIATTLQTQVTTLQAQVTALQTQVTTLQTKVTTLETANTALQTQVTTLQSNTTALQAALTAETAARTAGDAAGASALAALAEEIDAIATVGKAYAVNVQSTFLVNGQLGTVAVLQGVPAGRYLVVAKTIVMNSDNDAEWHCRLLRNNEQFPNVLDRSAATTESGFIENKSNITLAAIATLPAPGSFRVDCFTLEADSTLEEVKIIAVSVQ